MSDTAIHSARVIGLSVELQTKFRSRAQQLQMLPTVAVMALEIARDPDCSIQEFIAVVERDAKLATDMLSIANSAMFSSGGQKIVTLSQSVVRLGFRQCRNLILSSAMASMMKKLSLEDEWVRDMLWRHGLLTGILAMNINKVIGTGFQGEEFAAGLVHDFGRTLLAVCLPEKFLQSDPLDFEESLETLQSETKLMGTNHCEAGAWFAETNHLPSEFAEVIRLHHQPSFARGHRRLVALTSVSDHMANHMHRHEEGNSYDLQKNHAVSVLEACGVPNVASRLRHLFPEIMDTSRQLALEMSTV